METARSSVRVRSSPPTITIAIVDGDPLARHALRTRLAAEGDIEVVGEASDASAAIELVGQRSPDLALIALGLPDRSGTEALEELLAISPRTRVIVLAIGADEEAQMRVLRAGAAGCLPRSIDLGVLPRVVRGVQAGEAGVSRALGTRVLKQVNMLDPSDLVGLRPVRSTLTQREWEVLDLLVQGMTTGGIATQLQVSLATVRTHIKHILGKLEMHSRDEAIRYVKRIRHLVSIPSD
jgi:DNA-binding NarL/FixJ family response regulator